MDGHCVETSADTLTAKRYQPVPAGHDPRVISTGLVARMLAIPGLELRLNVDLSRYSRWKIGGNADCVICPHTPAALQQVVQLARATRTPTTVIGLSSNLLFPQEGIRALVIHLGRQFSALQINGTRVWAQAGIWVPGFARSLARLGLTGMEHLAGIPGTLGGLICMNGGSQRQSISDHLQFLTTLDADGVFHTWPRERCEFTYRHSPFQNNRHIITDASFEFKKAQDPLAVRRSMKRILEQRRHKFPQKTPNCGSVFVSDPRLYEHFGPPGAVIEQCGLKGTAHGGAEISRLHANFIVNRGGASSTDVLYLIDLIRTTVRRRTGLDLIAEAKYMDAMGTITPAHVAASRLRREGRL